MLYTVSCCESTLVLLCVHLVNTKQITVFFLISLIEVWLKYGVKYPKSTFLSVQHWLTSGWLVYCCFILMDRTVFLLKDEACLFLVGFVSSELI